MAISSITSGKSTPTRSNSHQNTQDYLNRQPTSNPNYDQQVISNQFLLSWIFASISEAMYGHVVPCQTSTEVCGVLEKKILKFKGKNSSITFHATVNKERCFEHQ